MFEKFQPEVKENIEKSLNIVKPQRRNRQQKYPQLFDGKLDRKFVDAMKPFIARAIAKNVSRDIIVQAKKMGMDYVQVVLQQVAAGNLKREALESLVSNLSGANGNLNTGNYLIENGIDSKDVAYEVNLGSKITADIACTVPEGSDVKVRFYGNGKEGKLDAGQHYFEVKATKMLLKSHEEMPPVENSDEGSISRDFYEFKEGYSRAYVYENMGIHLLEQIKKMNILKQKNHNAHNHVVVMKGTFISPQLVKEIEGLGVDIIEIPINIDEKHDSMSGSVYGTIDEITKAVHQFRKKYPAVNLAVFEDPKYIRQVSEMVNEIYKNVK